MSLILPVANLDKDKPGDKVLLKHIKKRARRMKLRHKSAGVLMILSEIRPGKKNVRVRPVGKKMKRKSSRLRFRKVTPFGVHNHMAIRDVKHRGETIRIASLHGLHRRSVGRVKHTAYFVALAAIVALWTLRGVKWVVAGDFNWNIHKAAKLLGGKAYGKNIDGVVCGPGVGGELLAVDRFGINNKLTGHPLIFVKIFLEN